MSEIAAVEKTEERALMLKPAQQADREAVGNYRLSTSVAALCKQLATDTAVDIGGKKYVPAATWEAIAVAHGCIVSTNPVEWIPKEEGTVAGFRCVAELRDRITGKVLSTADGFVGTDEPTWFGGETFSKRYGKKVENPKRPDFAIRAMCTTRAAGRVCKLAFAHVLALMNADLQTTPLEDVIEAELVEEAAKVVPYKGEPVGDWRNIHIHMPWARKHGPGCDNEHPSGKQLGELSADALKYYQEKFEPNLQNEKDVRLRHALDISMGRVKPETDNKLEGIPD